ncbi:TPA: BppU family phage baseplate upper protein [Enterococcus faecium]|nr:BppU family phage baseplate upper protein [Enterococcus faecium]NTM18221.1 BppU family phage baseplate upper protein [Enterococcus faecium]NTM21375.1 BppU family phage baseplate upper protein [Enterococcus faecium]HAQ4682870.1 BppU family phage baseplate upper protein [Enterococcus faecium]HAR1651687.1 BppU family phage baseplate upper protein [Enterococcus faecium]
MNRKTGEIVVPTEPVSRATKITGFTFKSYDKSAGVLQFQIKNQDGSPTDLIDATVRLFMYIYQGEEKKEFPIFDNQIITESYMQGIVKYPIPDMLLSYEGKVDANVYIDFPDGSHTDNLAFTFNIEKSIIDGDVQLNGEYYFKEFQQLLDGVKQEATDAVNAALTNVDSTIEKANQQINEFVEGATQAIDQTVDEVTEQLQATQTKIDTVSQNVTSAQNNLKAVEDKMNQTNQQIGDLGKLKKIYSNSIDFGGYDYSGNPNLMNNLSFSDFAVQAGGGAISDGGNFLKINKTSGTNLFVMAGYKNSAYYLTPVLPNTTYTITYVLRKSSNFVSQSGKRIFLRYRLNQNDVTNNLGELILDSTNVTAEFTTYTKTFTTGALINPNSYYFQVLVEEGLSGEIELSYEIKLERGSTATPYQPNLLDDPYWVGKAPLGENIADPTKKFPIKSSGAEIYTGTMTEPFVVGETYTVTLKGTKPADKNFRLFNPGIAGYGNLSPVEGVTDVWSLTVTVDKVAADPRIVGINQTPADNPGACQIDWLKIEKGDTRTQNISEYKYFGEGLKDSNNPNDYSWDIKPEYTEKGLNDSVSLTEPETILGLKNFAEGLQSSGVNVAVEYAKAIDTDKYTKHGAIYLGGCAWLAWETLTFQKTEGYAKGSYIRLGADGNASFTYSDVPNIFGGYLWLGGVCQPDYTDGGFGSYHITVENNFDDARKPIVRVIDSPSTPVKKLAVRGFALVFAPAPTENSQVKE